uniref:Laccase 5 n=1 Tax=Hypsizygus marmoreus TaxID=39966 RepID=A0A0A7DLU5_HYPMA|nr:Laccase 5 [Hypsizygus marmoreus]
MVWSASLVFAGLSFSLLVAANTVPILPPSQPNLPPTQLQVSNGFIAPDGFNRSAILVTGRHPGPLLSGKKGQKFRLHVANALPDDTMQRATSIHWHGFFQKGTNYAAGPVGVSQCPISPNNSFLYEFVVHAQAGTFWYHSHFSTQYCDGLRGPFVLYAADQDPHRHLYAVAAASTVITLGEWYHTPAPSIITIPQAHSTLLNGKGRYSGGPPVDLAVVHVVQHKRYRLRLLSVSCDPNYVFSIAGHQLKVIEVASENILPYNTASIQIFAGQRYSFILPATQRVHTYWVRALSSSGKGNLSTGFVRGVNSAILRYKGARKAAPTTSQKKNGTLLEESALRPLLLAPRAPGAPHHGGADVRINLDIGDAPVSRRFLLNNETFVSPTVPVLLQMLSGAKTAQDLLPQGSIYLLPTNTVIAVTIPGGAAAGPHPFHLHGHSFSVVRSAGTHTKANYMHPVRRDVVNIGAVGSTVPIRFTTDNPGPWFLHCHIDWHLAVGLAVVFAEDPAHTSVPVQPPEAWRGLCPTYDALPPSATEITTVPEVP